METYTVHEAASMLGMRTRAVRRAIDDGDLEAEGEGHDLEITHDALEEFAEERGTHLDDSDDDDLEARTETALEEHRPSWEAGFRSGFAAGTHEDSEDA